MTVQATTNAPEERRWTRGAWLALALALGYLLAGVFYVLAAYRQPSDGWNASYDVSAGWVVTINQGGAAGLLPGDRILAIAGQNVDTDRPPRRAPPSGWAIGATARYTIVRDGRTRDVDAPLVRIPASALPRFILLGADDTNFAALLTLIFGFVIFLLRPGSVAARLLLLILTYFVGTATIWFAFSTPAIFVYPALLYSAYYGIALWPLMFAMIAHLALAFPLRTWPLTRWPRLTLGLLYGLPGASCIIRMATASYSVYVAALLAGMLAMACAIVGATIHNLRSGHNPVVRAQVSWVALGLSSSFVLAALSGALSLISPNAGDAGGYLPFLALPLCLGIAITRYRLFDIEVIIRRTLVYSTLTLILALVYVGCIVVLQRLVAPFTGDSNLAVAASTLAIAALFFPLRRRIQTIIDKRFYRRKYDATKVLAAFALTARDETDLQRLTDELLRVVDETVQPEFMGLWLKEVPSSKRKA